MNELKEYEKELKEKFNNIESTPFNEKLTQIEPRLDKEEKPLNQRRLKLFSWVTIAASFLCLIICGLTMFFNLKPDVLNEPSYLDDEIKVDECVLEDLLSMKNLYLPNLSDMIIDSVNVGRHLETNENVYFIVNGFFDDGAIFRELNLTIILKKEYFGNRINGYTDLPNKITIDEKTINYNFIDYINPFYNYYVGFVHNDVRYYFQYKSIVENDLADFLSQFLV